MTDAGCEASDAGYGKAGKRGRGEAANALASEEALGPRLPTRDTGQGWLEQVLARRNLQRAWKRVKANRGAAGVDRRDIARTGAWLKVRNAQRHVPAGYRVVVDVDLKAFFDHVNHDILF